ncbi:hypothetical protein CMK14_10005 [Candidatus Poribacteria bacterium]|nr:hypothetical protein [Candidatus Poribacteria bacterium]
MTIAERDQRVIGFHRHTINQRDFDSAYIYKEIHPSDFAPPQTSLAQNYPNPFNPEPGFLTNSQLLQKLKLRFMVRWEIRFEF